MEGEPSCFASYKALQIPCILQNVFTYLPHADLKRARLVNRVFNDESSRIIRKRSKIVLNSSKRLVTFLLENFMDVHTFCEGFQLVNVPVATSSIKMLLDTHGQAFKSLDLRDSKWSFEELKDMLLKASTQLEEVIIHGQLPKEPVAELPVPNPHPGFQEGLGRQLLHNNNGNNRNRSNQVPVRSNPPRNTRRPSCSSCANHPVEEKVIVEKVLWLPKVKRVDLQLYDKLPEDDFLQDIILKILTATKNIEILRSSESRKGKSRRERFHRILFDTLIDPKFNILLPNLTKIDFTLTPWGDDQYHRFRLKNFPLTYLSLAVLPNISTSAVVKLLTSLKSTLTKLKISFTNWKIMEFPDLELTHLRHLSLDWYNGSLKFVTRLTRLETLILAQVDLNQALKDFREHHDPDDEAFIRHKRHQLLSSFELYQPSGAEIFPGSVRKLSAIFPNLKKLVLGKLTNKSLCAVFTVFPALEEFSGVEGTFTDEGVTGIAVKPCHVCGSKHLTELCKGMYNEVLVNSQRRHCYIGDLKNLRKLELRAPGLTNLSVYHGVLQCKRLRSLSLRSFHLTFGSLRRMIDTLPLEYLESTHTFSHTSEIKYAMKKMRDRPFILNGLNVPKESNTCWSSPEMAEFFKHLVPFIHPRSVDNRNHGKKTVRHRMETLIGALSPSS